MKHKRGYLELGKKNIVETADTYLKLKLEYCRKQEEYRRRQKEYRQKQEEDKQTHESDKENVEFTEKDSPSKKEKKVLI